jgi:hypothetical protein
MSFTAATFHPDKSLVNELAPENITCRRHEQRITHEQLVGELAKANALTWYEAASAASFEAVRAKTRWR